MPHVMKNLHIPLPEGLHRRIHEEATQIGRPVTELAREAIAAWLDEMQRKRIHADVARYAAECAGSRADFDPALAKASAEHLRDMEDRE